MSVTILIQEKGGMMDFRNNDWTGEPSMDNDTFIDETDDDKDYDDFEWGDEL